MTITQRSYTYRAHKSAGLRCKDHWDDWVVKLNEFERAVGVQWMRVLSIWAIQSMRVLDKFES